jgi:uncharacterized protein (TIGR02271 family)
MTDIALEAAVARGQDGWSVRLPVRAEHVRARKRAVVIEEVRLRRDASTQVVRVAAEVRREELHVERP